MDQWVRDFPLGIQPSKRDFRITFIQRPGQSHHRAIDFKGPPVSVATGSQNPGFFAGW